MSLVFFGFCDDAPKLVESLEILVYHPSNLGIPLLIAQLYRCTKCNIYILAVF